jgi:hypothetical protein
MGAAEPTVLVATVTVELAAEDAGSAAAVASALLEDDAVSTVRIERAGVPSVLRVDVPAGDEHEMRARALRPVAAVADLLGVRFGPATVVLRGADAPEHPAAG